MAESKGLSSSASSLPSLAPFAGRASARPFRDPEPPLSSPAIAAGALPCVASMSITSRSAIEPAWIASRHASTARMVSGLPRRPSSMVRRPASMRLASATSPSRVRSVVRPISRRYISHRIAGKPDIVSARLGCSGGRSRFRTPFLDAGLRFLALGDGDAQLGQQRHRILDPIGAGLAGRQGSVQLVMGDVAALPAAGDHLGNR